MLDANHRRRDGVWLVYTRQDSPSRRGGEEKSGIWSALNDVDNLAEPEAAGTKRAKIVATVR